MCVRLNGRLRWRRAAYVTSMAFECLRRTAFSGSASRGEAVGGGVDRHRGDCRSCALRIAAVDKGHQNRFLHELVYLGYGRVQLLWCRRKITNFEFKDRVSDLGRQVDFSRAVRLNVCIDQSSPE